MRRGENIYKRKDKRWEGRYAVGRKSNGKLIYRSVYGRTVKDVQRKLYPLKAKYQKIMDEQGSSRISLEEWGFHWLHAVKPDVKDSTFANYNHKLCHYVIAVLGHYALNELNEATSQQLLDDLIQRGLKPSTMHVIFRIAKQCANAAIEKKLINSNPFSSIRLPKAIKVVNQALTKQEQKKLEETAMAEKNGRGLPTLLALHAGLRIGEVAALAWSDVDFENGQINVKSTYQRIFSVFGEQKTELIYTSAKTASSIRSIPMSNALREALLEHKEQSVGEFVFSTKDNPLEPRLLTYHFHKIREKAGLDHVHFHQLRHTFATRCVESRADVKNVSYLMGHSSALITLDTYTGSMKEQRIEVVKQMEQSIG
ncbi:site-specific integrase [Enterococcus sp. 669A]|uniref:Site-specific integrase n=1 Tax=Candidatus Enterococcus moelleringii TaxID=2815325 RepID=A0ABS3LHW2_9ENTE|nr:site-specific integrase [Enterococcus sp. 669A]MBO1308643.1 site-specific integrase [Enterococcus sp. 669A]